MKKLALVIAAVLLLSMVPLHPSYAKPAYCKVALVRCFSDCGSGTFGEWCKGGCGIGYLLC